MSLKRNMLANYASQIYVTLVGVVMLPLYIKYTGAEVYGLVGFFSMLQAWFQLLDMGLTPTMARESARYQGGAVDAHSLHGLLRTLEVIFFGMALVGALGIIAAANSIATQWLNAQSLSVDEVRYSVMIMGVIVALRWTSGLYRGVINGFEKIVWLSNWNAFIATLRFVLVIPVFIFVGTSPANFFSYQLGVALLEMGGLLIQTYALMPKLGGAERTPWNWQPLRGVLKFSFSIALTGSVWVLVTQTDKLVLSKILSLEDYGYFALAVLLAGGVMMISGPISTAIMPRMTRFQAEGNETGLIDLYRKATQIVAVIAVPATLVLTLFPDRVLWAWTGNALLVSKAAPVLTLYALGSGILALGAFPYYLQYAKGDLKLHLIGSLLFVLLLIPSLIWGTLQFGMIGAGGAWLSANLIYFLVWVPLVHHRFACGLHWRWLKKDVLYVSVPSILIAWFMKYEIVWYESQLGMTIQLCMLCGGLVCVACLSSSFARRIVADHIGLRKWL